MISFAHLLNKSIGKLTGFCIARTDRISDTPTELPPCDLWRAQQPHLRDERWGKWSDSTIARYTSLAEKIDGDFVEIGVAKGTTFYRLARIAAKQGKLAHAIDSFYGLSEAGEFDRQEGEEGARKAGAHSVNGENQFIKLMDEKSLSREVYNTWEGWIPEVFLKGPHNVRFSLALLDVDMYQPTADSLPWVWERINIGGYLLLDDCAFGAEKECTRAIKEFLSVTNGFWIMNYNNNQLILRKDQNNNK